MKGVVLAAGLGSRLLPLTADRPKAMVDIGGAMLLERLVSQCAAAGLHEVVVVTGHHAGAVDEWVRHREIGIPVRTVWNPHYADRNNAHSLWVAREALGGSGFVKFDGDLLMHTDILRRLVQSEAPSALVLDRAATREPEQMKARLGPDGRVLALGKWLAQDESHGESIGIEKIDEADAERVFSAIEQVVERDGRHDAYYEDVYHVLLEQGWALGSVDTGGLPWTEIDTPEDLEYARSLRPRLDGADAWSWGAT